MGARQLWAKALRRRAPLDRGWKWVACSGSGAEVTPLAARPMWLYMWLYTYGTAGSPFSVAAMYTQTCVHMMHITMSLSCVYTCFSRIAFGLVQCETPARYMHFYLHHIYTCTHTFIFYIPPHAHKHTQMHMYRCIHTYLCTRIHMYISYTCIFIYKENIHI